MRPVPLLLLCLAVSGCNMHDRRINHPPVENNDYTRNPRKTEFTIGTYQSMVEGLRRSAPGPNLQLLRSGQVTYVQGRDKTQFHFEYAHTDRDNWSLLVNDAKSGENHYSLKRNHLGMTYQDLRQQVFLQGTEHHTWARLQKMEWQSLLDETCTVLHYPTFDSAHDWHIEADGLKYLIISRVDMSGDEAVKYQYYIHKKSQTVQRIIKSTLAQNIVEEIHYANFRQVGESYLPSDISLTRSLGGEKISIHVNSSGLEPVKTRGSALRAL